MKTTRKAKVRRRKQMNKYRRGIYRHFHKINSLWCYQKGINQSLKELAEPLGVPITNFIPERTFPHPECPDCNGSGAVQVGPDQYKDCPCLSPDPHESVCPKCGSVMGMVTMGEWRCFKC